MKLAFTLLLATLLSNPIFAQNKQIAITIDDLPFVGEARNFHLNLMKNTLTQQQIPATGFIIAKEVHSDNWAMLSEFKDAGFGLGNHTYSHANLNALSTEEYINEIKKADELLVPLLTKPKYFRYPYLAMGNGDKKDKILCYLLEKDYQIAPITIDSKDFVFNQRLLSVPELGRRAYFQELMPFYLDFIKTQTLKAEESNPNSAQILLIHANLLNAYALPSLIALYRQQGYTFVSLEEALKTHHALNQCPKSHWASAKKY